MKTLIFDNQNSEDFYSINIADQIKIKNEIVQLIKNRLPAKFGYNPVKDIQVICAYREYSTVSCKELNLMLQRELNHNIYVPKTKSKFKYGDKVIQTKNDYQLGILNGDIGYIVNCDEKTIHIKFDDVNEVIKVGKNINDIELAYAITCHKFQGSEAPAIIIPIAQSGYGGIVNNNWLYTAISRAQKTCIIVGRIAETNDIINRKPIRRETNLNKLFKEEARRESKQVK